MNIFELKREKLRALFGKASLLRDTLVYGGANYVVQAIGVVNSVALRRFMGPVSMGIWSILQVILGYCGYASFGTTKAMARDYPYYRGKGEHEKAEQLKDLILTFSLAMSVIPAGLILGYLIVKWNELVVSLRIGLLFISGFLFLQRFYDVVINLLRSDRKFVLLSQLTVINAAAGLGVSILLVSLWNIYGLMFGTAIVMLACLVFIYKRSPYQFRYLLDVKALWRELRLGIPLVAITFLSTLLTSLDKLIIAKHLGFYEVGLYSIAMMVNSYMFSTPMMFSNVWFPYLQEEYGRKGTPDGVKHYLLAPIFGMSVSVPFLSGIAIFLSPVVAHLILPKFAEGIPAMKIYLVGTFFLLLGQFSGKFLVTLDRYLLNLPILGISITLNYFLNVTFVKLGWGLEGVAKGSVISFIVYGVASYFAALRHFSDTRDILENLSRIGAILLGLFGLILALDHFVAWGNLYLSAIVKVGIFVLVSVPSLWLVNKRMDILGPMKALLSKGRESPSEVVETEGEPEIP
jgi:O-antigen/teichoic acid export membrane protein